LKTPNVPYHRQAKRGPVEVVAAFWQYMAGGDSVADAAFCALSDWDI